MSQQTTNRTFDDLAKGLATGTLSRGKALRWMGGALLGAALASVPGVAWADGCRGFGRACRRDSQCCSRRCIRRGGDKVCACPEGQSRCGDRCVNRKRNENHCGQCFNQCPEGQECVRGECQGQGGCRPSGGTPTEGDCTCAVTCGAVPSQFTCREENPNCQCTLTVEDLGFCADPSLGDCATLPECSSSMDCEGRSECVANPCCRDTPACFPPCCRGLNFFCSTDSECCSGHCVDGGCTQGCQDASECPPPAFPLCQQATCTNGVCGVENLPDGTPCDRDENECTIEVCRGLECVATGETVC